MELVLGESRPRDPDEGRWWIQKAAEGGHPEACVRVGDARAYEDAREALRWYSKAAEAGDIDALLRSAELCLSGGANLIWDPDEAVRWFERAVQAGSTAAAFSLGRLFSSGERVPPEPERAARWYRRAAEAGHAAAQRVLGMSLAGQAATRSQGLQWLESAARQHDLEAARALGEILWSDPATRRSSIEWLELAGGRGDERSLLLLAEAYARGEGVALSLEKAFQLCSLVVEGGWVESAKKRAAGILRRLPPERAAQLRRARAKWISQRLREALKGRLLALPLGIEPDGEQPAPNTDASKVASAWRRIEAWLAEHAPAVLASLADGVSAKALVEAEEALGMELPPSFKESYMIHGGQLDSAEAAGLIFGFRLQPLQRIVDGWRYSWGDSDDSEEPNTSPDLGTSADFIRDLADSRCWVAFCDDSGGNSIGIDLDPPTGGTRGQIINFGPGEKVRFVLSTDMGEFLETIASAMEEGRCDPATLGLRSHPHYLDSLRALPRYVDAERWCWLVHHELHHPARSPAERRAIAAEATALAARTFPEDHPNRVITARVARE